MNHDSASSIESFILSNLKFIKVQYVICVGLFLLNFVVESTVCHYVISDLELANGSLNTVDIVHSSTHATSAALRLWSATLPTTSVLTIYRFSRSLLDVQLFRGYGHLGLKIQT